MEDHADPQEFLAQCLDIDEANLDEHFKRLPGELAYWTARYAEAYKAHEIAVADLKAVRGRELVDAKATMQVNGKPPTDTWLTAHVDSHEDVMDAHVQAANCLADKIRLRGVVDTMMAKRDMLQSWGAKLRVQMMGDPTVRERVAWGGDG